MLEHEIQTTLETMNDYRLLLRIRPALKRCMVGKTSASKKIEIIATDSGVTIEEFKRLLQNNIRKLLTMELDLDALKSKVTEVKKMLENIDQHVLDQYQAL